MTPGAHPGYHLCMRPKALLALLALLVLATGQTPPAWSAQPLNLDPSIETLDQVKSRLRTLEHEIDDSLRDDIHTWDMVALRDLSFFTKNFQLELHHLVDIYILCNFKDLGKSFSRKKAGEFRKSARFTLQDARKRLQYVRLDKPFQDPSLVNPFRKRLVRELELAINTLSSILAKMKEGNVAEAE